MAENVKDVSQSLHRRKARRKKTSTNKSRWAIKNSLRGIRRKRSKTRYYKSLKQLRYNRKTDDLCSAVRVFDISDMDWAPSVSSVPLPPEITEWQQQEQIAYWKSRAISLELENRMLYEHLRNVYAKTIDEQAQTEEHSQYREDSQDKEVEKRKDAKIEGNKYKKQRKKGCDVPESNVEVTKESCKELPRAVSPKEPEGKNRFEELKKIYGEAAPKIMGMETALQLNYERIMTKSKPPYWPGLPLRLSFD